MEPEDDKADGKTPPPGTPPGDNGVGDKGKVYTEEQVAARMRGLSKVNAEMKAQLDKLTADAKARADAEKTTEQRAAELALARDGAVAELATIRAALKQEEQEIDEENERAIKKLPEAVRDVAKTARDGGLAPKALAKLIGKLVATVASIPVAGGSGRAGTPSTPEDEERAQRERNMEQGRAFVFGRKKEAKK